MPHISLPEHLPGITGLLEYRIDTAEPIRLITQILLRGNSSLTVGERELIATIVSSRNCTNFCELAHTKVADLLYGETETAKMVKLNFETAPISNKMKALLNIATLTQQGGKYVTDEAIERGKNAGATDLEIHDTVLIAALFCLYNKYVDGLATIAPSDHNYYQILGERILKNGYIRPASGYPIPEK